MKVLKTWVKEVDGKPVKWVKAVVHSFTLGDVEDPDIYAAQPLHNWLESGAGKWIIENAGDTPVWHKTADPERLCYKVVVVAELKESDAALYVLKWC